MKVGVYLADSINPSLGGNFSYYDKFIAAVDGKKFSSQLELCFVGRVSPDKVKSEKNYVQLSSSAYYKFFKVLSKLRIVYLLNRLFHRNFDFCAQADGKILRRHDVDLILFPTQFLKEVNDFPFITMNWDAGHKTTYAFPELLENFESRDVWYRVIMQKGLSIFVESESSRQELHTYYGVPHLKMEVIPLFAGGVIDMDVAADEQRQILEKTNVEKLKYYYYPAQFWAHKNHIALLDAFDELHRKPGYEDLKLVLSGSDKGNKEYIVNLVKARGLQTHVIVLGFISNEAVLTFYRNALALVMPTYLGPTNMPVIEAQALGTAVICSDLAGHRESNGDGAIYLDPSDAKAWCEAMMSVCDDAFRTALISRADKVYRNSPFKIDTAMEKFESALIRLIPVRKTFR